MQPKPLRTTNGMVRFASGFVSVEDPVSWFKRKGFVFVPLLTITILNIIIGYELNHQGQIIAGVIALIVLLVVLLFSLNSYKGKNEVEDRLIQTAHIRSVVFKKPLLARYITIVIFLPQNKYRVVQCTQYNLEHSGFVAFLKESNIQVVLP